MVHLTLVPAVTRSYKPDYGFSSHDLIALTCWMQRADGHGYSRMLIENGSGGRGPEEGGYVLIYTPRSDWAAWGLTRHGTEIVVWHCGTGADLGRFATMLQALERLPTVWTPGGRQVAGTHKADVAFHERTACLKQARSIGERT